jgi:hypothetical protein
MYITPPQKHALDIGIKEPFPLRFDTRASC